MPESQDKVSIRPWGANDLPLLERLMGDPVMTKHLGGPETPEQLQNRHARYLSASQSGKLSMFVIEVGDESKPAGSIGYWERATDGGRVWETGWSVLPEFQGQGIASKATNLIVEMARAEGTHRFIHAYPSVGNAPSNAICRKAGFTMVGTDDFEYPPGHPMLCNDWALDLFPQTPK